MIILLKTYSMFSSEDVSNFNRRNLRVFIGSMFLFLAVFIMLWIGEMIEVITTGDTSTGSYSSGPTGFWVIRSIDLGITLPLGIISLYLLWTHTSKAYPLILLFFGYFVSIGTAVFTMAVVMLLRNDPLLQEGGLFIFAVLMILAWIGFLYLIKDKIPFIKRKP